MPRRRVAEKREILPDPIYNSVVVSKFINGIMKTGKKSRAEEIFYKAMEEIAEKTGEEALKVFQAALDNVAPTVEVKSRRIGGATYQVPIEVTKERRNTLAIRWIIAHARARSERTMKDKLVGEITDASSNRGGSVRNRENVHRMAEANKAFAHYRF
ncbi:MAG: 30S ribosomal protein S7 [Acidobacteria bacterium]|nr:MAG: 30S ribosomal protein S7 [Acidobacteriota bacterium]REK02548.1 MAG: 30S ribosomal protein S7 [Acidobacteriota bacterium]REK13649.1 MAG: 30S ribosomal protein S7 [Acidobacteriota bacterium]REK41643.1 MAG: 30S ribosomal protein S7 [Acidobacteriota bacterium]